MEFFCEAEGTPFPTVNWFKDGREIHPSEKVIINGNKIRVKRLEKSDAGVYMCLFKNSVGSVKHYIKLVIQGEKIALDRFELQIIDLRLH